MEQLSGKPVQRISMIKTVFIAMLTAVLTTLVLSGGFLSLLESPPSQLKPGRAEQLKDNVTFIFQRSGTNYHPLATGFWTGIPFPDDTNRMAAFLVTSKHVVLEGAVLRTNLYLRYNLEGFASYTALDALTLRDRMIIHNDPTVDLVAIGGRPSQTNFTARFLTLNDIVTREEFKKLDIEEGDEVFFVGLFTSFYGLQKNYPLFRWGKVGMVTDEKIPWFDGATDLYVIEAQSYPGNSGSPVFFNLGPVRKGTISFYRNGIRLAGVVTGSFLNGGTSGENVGICTVTPAHYLHEMLTSARARQILVKSGEGLN